MSNETWVFTFGCGQRHAGHFVRLSGTHDEAREKMFRLFGEEWCWQYSEEQWAECLKRAKDRGIAPERELHLRDFIDI